MFKILTGIPRKLLLAAIGFYQKYLSLDTGLPRRLGLSRGGVCGFYPTCSEYSKEAIEKYGVFKGLWLSLKRIAHCHPWAEPKIDKVP